MRFTLKKSKSCLDKAAVINPVAVTINRAMIEIPPKFAGKSAVNPDAQSRKGMESWEGSTGLAADVEYYGNWMRDEAFRRIGNLYPKVNVPKEQGGGEATVIAWIWTRTVKCPNPACGHDAVLVRSFDISKKKGRERHVVPHVEGEEIVYTVENGKSPIDGTMGRKGAVCIRCGSPISFDEIRESAQAGEMKSSLMAVVAEGKGGRLYCCPDKEQVAASCVERPAEAPDGQIAYNPRDIRTHLYGIDNYSNLFTNRQLTALTTLCDLVQVAQEQARKDAVSSGMADDGIGLDKGGTGATAYGEAVGVYLAFLVDKMTDYHSAVCSWNSSGEKMRNTFGRQAIPMVWDYAEGNPFCDSSGSLNNMLNWITKCIGQFPRESKPGVVQQFDAQSDNGQRNIMVSTDPPYYDNIGYADLSDYFYVWLRQSLRKTYPKLFSTMLVPKMEELVATPYRDNRGKDGARNFFEEGMFHTFQQVYEYARDDIPVTIYYAFKQSETESINEVESTASTGWETMLSAIIRAGFSITGTWPMRTEMGVRMIATGTNALASSIVLVCRKRDDSTSVCTRRDFVNALKRELKEGLDKLKTSNIAPVDLAQSAIGPGIGVYSRYGKVLESDGSEMTVRTALQIINQELDLYFADQDGELDKDSRFCVDLYQQSAFRDIPFGDADVLARAKNTSIQGLADKGVLDASKGIVHLKARDEISEKISLTETLTWKLTQQLTHAMEIGGVVACAKAMAPLNGGVAEHAKALAYRLFTIADKKGWNQEAFAYNSLIVAWPEIQSKAAQIQSETPFQEAMNFGI